MGAWWLGFIVNGTVVLLSCIPFWFLPKSLPKQEQEESPSKSTELAPVAEQESFLPEDNQDHVGKEKQPTFQELAKGTFQHPASTPENVIDTLIPMKLYSDHLNMQQVEVEVVSGPMLPRHSKNLEQLRP